MNEHTPPPLNAKAILRGIAPQFVVDDVVATAKYYRDKLGFAILGYFLDPPVFAMVRRGAVEIHFGKRDPGTAPPGPTQRKVGVEGYIWVDDLPALLAEFKSAGIEIVE